jgi:phosphatidylinositol dimannoside acyltransferase
VSEPEDRPKRRRTAARRTATESTESTEPAAPAAASASTQSGGMVAARDLVDVRSGIRAAMGTVTSAGGTRSTGRRTLKGTLLLAACRLLGALPEAPLVAACESIGELWYRISPERAAQARANLGRVCEGLAAQGRGTSLARRAATDPDALELLVRRCFRHAVRYYLEIARVGSEDLAAAVARIDVETPEAVREALLTGRPVIAVGMHFGAIEMPIAVISHMTGHRVTAPMETVGDPALRDWFESSRSAMGVNIVPLKDSRRALLNALRRGESIGLVNDRDLTRTGVPIPFFGHPAPISPAPVLFALEADVPVFVGTARRRGRGRYTGKLIPLAIPAEGTRRARMLAATEEMARLFETLLADAPEQWWGAMHPIWPDLVVGSAPAGDASAPGAAPATTGHDVG